jgi:hypothetical protein
VLDEQAVSAKNAAIGGSALERVAQKLCAMALPLVGSYWATWYAAAGALASGFSDGSETLVPCRIFPTIRQLGAKTRHLLPASQLRGCALPDSGKLSSHAASIPTIADESGWALPARLPVGAMTRCAIDSPK